MSLLEIAGLHAAYGPIRALSGVDLTVGEGEIVALIGANGAGKSTLLMTICGNPPAAAGRVIFAGRDITRLATHEIARLGIAQVPEGRRIFPRMTVLENLKMGGTAARAGAVGPADYRAAYDLFPILEERQSQRAGTLSGGEQQMLAIGRALMSRPRLLLLDEPSLGLAPLIVKRIFAAIGEINRHGTTVLLVEQNAYHALKLAHRAYVMTTGRIVMSGRGADLLANREVRAAYLEGGHGLDPASLPL